MAFLSLLVILFVPNEGKGYGEGKSPLKKHRISLLILQIVPSLLVLLSPLSDRTGICTFPESNGLRLAGLILTSAGFVWMNLAIMALGKQFSVDVTIQEGHRLVTSGPYKYIRHPRYLGIIVFLTGISLVFRSWMAILIVVFVTGVLIWRVLDEEKLMAAEFPDEWKEYKKRSRALIPFIW